MARIRARRVNTHVLEVHIPENACKGILKIRPLIKGLKVYVISTSFRTKFGASGSELGAGLPVPALPHPELVHVSQFAFWLLPDPLTPEPDPFRLMGLQTCTEAPVGFQTAPVISWYAK